MSRKFSWPVRTYWEDTDAGGIVYYANYLKFMERARSEWLRALGVEQTQLKQSEGLMFVVVRAEADFRKPARYGDLLQVTCEVTQSTRASLTFRQDIVRAGTNEATDDEVLVNGVVRIACLDAVKFRPRPLPEILLQEIGVGGKR
jgi:acyl-CoA thioester hydrolase